MLGRWMTANRVHAAFLLGMLYVGCLALLVWLEEAEVDEDERVAALRVKNAQLHHALARAAERTDSKAKSDPDGGPK